LEGYGEDRQAGLGMLRLGSFGMAVKVGSGMDRYVAAGCGEAGRAGLDKARCGVAGKVSHGERRIVLASVGAAGEVQF
jgi:hypothetical protein